ncbi:50S ribosomal protein L5 [Patescibacteria group bacterium]|nr:50S ribosomal protein L5 [Patescibacteria group bacterium]
MSSDLKEIYSKKVIPAMRAEFGYKNVMAVPKIEKATVNIGVGRIKDEKQMKEVERVLALVTGQKASPRPAKKAIASFKTRKGQIIGYSVTLRGRRMFDFLGRLIGVALPRGRDFRGIPEKSFDKAGNLTIGVKEHIVFPEMVNEDVKFIFGMEVSVTTTAKNKAEGVALLRHMGFPIKS